MLTSGDVVGADLGMLIGREAGFAHPAVIVTAQRVLDGDPSIVHVVPLTTTRRRFGSEIPVDANRGSGLAQESSAQCQHLRSISTARVTTPRGNVGAVVLSQIRETIGVLLDIEG